MDQEYERLIENDITSPVDEISFFSKSFMSSEYSLYYIDCRNKLPLLKCQYSVKNSHYKDIFFFEISNVTRNGYIQDLKNNITYNVNVKPSINKNEMVISSGKMFNDRKTIIITKLNSLNNLQYRIEFFNQITRNFDILDIISDYNHKYCCVYYRNLYGNDVLICTIRKPRNFKFNYILEIAAGVDFLLIYSVVFYLI